MTDITPEEADTLADEVNALRIERRRLQRIADDENRGRLAALAEIDRLNDEIQHLRGIVQRAVDIAVSDSPMGPIMEFTDDYWAPLTSEQLDVVRRALASGSRSRAT